ncbi:MAG: sugar phosphate isomerase/epimerase family protein [Phycisphaerales bacterium JB052]
MIDRLGVCSWSLQPAGVGELVERLGACGERRVQLALCPLLEHADAWASLREHTEAGRVVVCSGMMETIGEDYASLERIKVTGGVRPDEHWGANLDRATRCADLANELGLSLVTLHAGFIPEDDPQLHDRMAERLCRIAEVFNAKDITFGLETGQERAETLLELLSTISTRVRVGVNFDPANMILYGMGDPTGAMQGLREHIVQVHMKDAIATDSPGTWGTEVAAGDGQVDWDAFFDIVQGLPQSVDVVIEREAGEQRVEDIRKAAALAKSQIQRVRS